MINQQFTKLQPTTALIKLSKESTHISSIGRGERVIAAQVHTTVLMDQAKLLITAYHTDDIIVVKWE